MVVFSIQIILFEVSLVTNKQRRQRVFILDLANFCQVIRG